MTANTDAITVIQDQAGAAMLQAVLRVMDIRWDPVKSAYVTTDRTRDAFSSEELDRAFKRNLGRTP